MSFNSKLLPNNWVHSHEEDSDNKMVFRPADYAFPPSRGRQSLHLKTDGNAVSGGPGADDRSIKSNATWKIENDCLVVHDKDTLVTKMKVLSVAKDKLVVEK